MNRWLDPLSSMIITLAGIAVVSIISIAMKNYWAFSIGLILVLGLTFGGILRFRAGEIETTKLTCLVVTVVGWILGFVALFTGTTGVAIGIVYIFVVVPTGYAWYTLQRE